MVTVTFKFNKEKLKKYGKTEDEMLEPIKELMEHYDVEEVAHGVFRKDGYYGMDVIDLPLMYIRKHLEYLDYLDEWIMDVDGKFEDCKEGMISYYKKWHPEKLK